jgi:hypothetical protein
MNNVISDEAIVAIFDEQRSPNWSPDSDINELFLRCQKNYANDLLKIRGHLFLNDVYDMLGLTRTAKGQLVGWLFTNANTVEFWKEELGEGNTVFLKFNVDGVIYDKLEIEGP